MVRIVGMGTDMDTEDMEGMEVIMDTILLDSLIKLNKYLHKNILKSSIKNTIKIEYFFGNKYF